MPRRVPVSQFHLSGEGRRILTLARTGNQTLNAGAYSVFYIKPTANLTLSAASFLDGARITVLIEQMNTTSRTVTFGTGMKSTGTLATGTAANKIFTVSFISNGVNLIETGRTAATTVS